MQIFGPSFGAELTAAGLGGLPLTWGSDGLVYGPSVTDEQRTAVEAVFAAHDPTRPAEPPEATARAERDARLHATDGAVLRHRDQVDAGGTTTLSPEEYAALLAYRQALRDVPAQADFPGAIDWPEAPA